MVENQNLQTQVVQTEKNADAGFPPFDSTTFSSQIIWLAICFVGLYLFLSRIVLPRISLIIEQRQNRISRDLDEAQRFKDEAERAIASYEQALTEARSKAQNITNNMRDELQAEIEAEKADVEKRIDDKLKEADARIAKSKENALKHVNEVASDITQALLDKLISVEVTDKEITEAVKAPLKKAS